MSNSMHTIDFSLGMLYWKLKTTVQIFETFLMQNAVPFVNNSLYFSLHPFQNMELTNSPNN